MSKRKPIPEPDYSMPANHHDESPVVLTDEQSKKALHHMAKAAEVLKFLYDDVNDRKLTVQNRFNCLGLVYHRLEDAGKILGAEEDVSQRREADIRRIRELHEQVKLLEAALADSAPIDVIPEKLKYLIKTVNDYWQMLGFSFVTCKFSDAYMTAEFRMHLWNEHDDMFDTGKKDQSQFIMSKLKLDQTNARDIKVIDCPFNRKVITKLIKKRFPGIYLMKFESRWVMRDDVEILVGITAEIPILSIEESKK